MRIDSRKRSIADFMMSPDTNSVQGGVLLHRQILLGVAVGCLFVFQAAVAQTFSSKYIECGGMNYYTSVPGIYHLPDVYNGGNIPVQGCDSIGQLFCEHANEGSNYQNPTFLRSDSRGGSSLPDHRNLYIYCELTNPPHGEVFSSRWPFGADRKSCPSGQRFNYYNIDASNPFGQCDDYPCPNPGETWHKDTGLCAAAELTDGGPDKDRGSGCLGNPCDPASGNKYQSETDFRLGDLEVVRGYNSSANYDMGFGFGWESNLLKRLTLNLASNEIIVRKSSGYAEAFTYNGGAWQGDAESDFILIDLGNGYQVTHKDGSVESYDVDGKLASMTSAAGKTRSYSYDSEGQLSQITDHFGRSITIEWYLSHVDRVLDPQGGVYDYVYDANFNLVEVIYPDGSNRQYHYENTSFPNHLTGITDENGDRYATFAYDSQGRAIRTEHADVTGTGPQEQFQIHYGSQ